MHRMPRARLCVRAGVPAALPWCAYWSLQLPAVISLGLLALPPIPSSSPGTLRLRVMSVLGAPVTHSISARPCVLRCQAQELPMAQGRLLTTLQPQIADNRVRGILPGSRIHTPHMQAHTHSLVKRSVCPCLHLLQCP